MRGPGLAYNTPGRSSAFKESIFNRMMPNRPTNFPRSIRLYIGRLPTIVLCAGLLGACQASSFLYRNHVTYNFTDEGFLSTHVLQTIGESEIEPSAYGTARDDRLCANRALNRARERALVVILHTYYDIEPIRGSSGSSTNTYANDYPHEFRPSELIRAEVYFRPILERGFIALQDNRARKDCTVVFRIEGPNLPGEIRSLPVTYEPDSLRRTHLNPGINRQQQGEVDNESYY